MPYHIYRITGKPVWSLAHHTLFKGAFGTFLEKIGAVSSEDPDRNRLIIKTLLTAEASWIIYPEGQMVKDKQIVEKGRYMVSYAGGRRPPHSGAATLGLRTEFYRERFREMIKAFPEEAKRLKELFEIESLSPVLENKTFIVPVNITYYPLRSRENILSNLASRLINDIPERIVEEIMSEGAMLLSGVDIDIRFGRPIDICSCMTDPAIKNDIRIKKSINPDDILPSRRTMVQVAVQIRQRYMTEIYKMTTVNHDHLFASILRIMPNIRVDEMDLRRRVFLSVIQKRFKEGINLHKSLLKDQSHLLLDDRFGHYREFVSIAIDKGLLVKKGDFLMKKSAFFAGRWNFHRVRIDNPLFVIANEIEPLKKLRYLLARIAFLPSFILKRRIAEYFLTTVMSKFEKEYKINFIEGESKPRSIGSPFFLKAREKKIGILLVHGYMAAPEEMRPLSEFLNKKGYCVFVPCLKGHGTSPDDLAKTSYNEWINSVNEGYILLDSICKRVVVGGFSMGAGLALEISSRIDRVAGVFAICPPMRLQDFSSRFVPAVDTWNRLMDLAHFEDAKKEFINNRPENPEINYFRNPISGIRELGRLMDNTKDKLQHIKAPVLVIQASDDPVVNPAGSRDVFKLIGADKKEYTVFNFKRHGILRGKGASKVYKRILSFVDDLE